MPVFGWDGLKRLGQKKQTPSTEVGTGPATKCEGCSDMLMKKSLEDNLGVCPSCGHHHRMTAQRRIETTLDPDTWEEINDDLFSKDILNFRSTKGYEDSLKKAVLSTETLSALRTGTGRLCNHQVALGVVDSRFIMGSMGSVYGEKFVRLAKRAIADRSPMIIFACSGGARMHEGMFSLMQMAKTSAVLGELHREKLPYIVVCTDPTTAGVWASWAALGDIIIGEPNALIGFTGARVIKATINCELPEDFQTPEFLLEHGQIDMIIPRKDMRSRLGGILDKLCGVPAEV